MKTLRFALSTIILICMCAPRIVALNGLQGGTIQTQKEENPTINIELKPGYEGVWYTYDFSTKSPPGIKNARWNVIKNNDMPIGIKLTESGLFYGIPLFQTKKNLLENKIRLRELKHKKRNSTKLTSNEQQDLEKAKEILNQKFKNYYFTLVFTGKINKENYSQKYDVTFKVKKSLAWNASENLSILAGYEQSGASSADPTQRLFLKLYFSSPFPFPIEKKNHPKLQLGRRMQCWGEVKLTTLPQQIGSSIVEAPETFSSTANNLKINEIARAIDFKVGFDFRLFDVKSSNGNNWYTLNLIGAYGATTPTTPRDSVQIFELPNADTSSQDLKRLKEKYQLGDLLGKEYISFVKPERSKFFRQWYFGFRIKTYSKPKSISEINNGTIIRNRVETQFPDKFEITFGRNDFIVDRELMLEALDAKRIKKDEVSIKNWLVVRLSGQKLIRIKSVKFYIFGEAIIKLHRNPGELPLLTEPIILTPATQENGIIPRDKIEQTTIINEYRDYYRIGVGVELMGILEKIF